MRKSTSDLTVTDAAGKVLMYAPVTTGSEHDPLPIGEWKVNGVQRNPTFHYNPDALLGRRRDAGEGEDSRRAPTIPVGVVWVDISRPHYGLHGTPEPSTVGKTDSHGCVRLTNWDAQKLAALVQARHESGLRGIAHATIATERRRPDFKYLSRAGCSASCSARSSSRRSATSRARARAHGRGRRGRHRDAAARAAGRTGRRRRRRPPSTIRRTPSSKCPRPTSGRTGVIPPTAPEAVDLTRAQADDPGRRRPGRASWCARITTRASGRREHEALDILAPRNTPVVAVEDGTIAKLFISKAGGITIYQFDPGQRVLLLLRPPRALRRRPQGGRRTSHRGQVLGYVGTSGNAPKDTPHLHFAVFRLTAEKHWWEGTPIDPYDILR